MDLSIHSLMREDSLECDRLKSTEREREKIFDKDREMFEKKMSFSEKNGVISVMKR